MRISAIQPLSSIDTAASHTPFQVLSSLVSLNSTPSPIEPAAVTENIDPVSLSWWRRCHDDPVGDAIGVAVPAGEALRDLRRLRVEHPRAE